MQCWHTEADSPCDWDVCRQPERLAAGDTGTGSAWTLDHRLHVLIQIEAREGQPNDKGERWVERRVTGKAIAVCSCGYTSGLVDSDTPPSVVELAREHPPFSMNDQVGAMIS